MNWPLVTQARFRRAEAVARKRHDYLWSDHLARCNCHDSWDQCPCTEQGHSAEQWPNDKAMIAACNNDCCRWCAGGENRIFSEEARR